MIRQQLLGVLFLGVSAALVGDVAGFRILTQIGVAGFALALAGVFGLWTLSLVGGVRAWLRGHSPVADPA